MKKFYTKPQAALIAFEAEQAVCSQCDVKVATALEAAAGCEPYGDGEDLRDIGVLFSTDNCPESDFYCYFTSANIIFGS